MPKELDIQPSRQLVYGLAIALFIYNWMSVNIYLPVLPKLEGVFHTSSASARLTVSVFLLGNSFAQLLWGPLSDRFGRRPVLLCGLAISIAGALLSAVANDVFLFAGFRFIEALGLGVAPVLARSVLTDRLEHPQVAVAMAYVTIAVATVPAIAAILGGYIDLLLSWRGIFVFLALYGVAICSLCFWRLPETNREKMSTLKVLPVLSGYLEMLRNGRYVGYVCFYGLAFGTLVGYYAAAPYIFIDDLGYRSHVYGYLLILNVACYILGALTSRFAVPRLGSDLPLLFALLAFGAASAIFLVLDFVTTMSTVSVLLPMSVFIFGAGMVSPAANAGAMTIFKGKAGAATAIVGFSVAMGGALFSGALAAIHITRLWELSAYVGVSTLLSFFVYVKLIRQRKAPDASQRT